MMARAERQGLVVALVGHALLFALLSTRVFAPATIPVPPKPIEVTFADEAALEPAAPRPAKPPAQSRAPDPGPPEDAAPPPAPAAKPLPKPEPPEPKSVPPAPAPKPVVKPAPAPKPTPKPAPAPTPKPVVKPAPKAPAKPVETSAAGAPPAKTAARETPAKNPPIAARDAPAKASASATRPTATAVRGTGSTVASTKPRPTGSRLGDDFLKGLNDQPSTSQSEAPVAPKLDAVALGAIQDAIRRQIQPCADRQVDPGPGANQIVTVLNLRLNPDGTLAATPTMVRQQGVDDENGRYSRRVIDLGIAAFKGCSPLKLPAEYYRTASGGWNNINYRWQLRE